MSKLGHYKSDPRRGEQMNPHGKIHGAWAFRWAMGALLTVLVILLAAITF